MADILTGFKTFIMRGNIVELAVAFVIGMTMNVISNSPLALSSGTNTIEAAMMATRQLPET